MAFMGVTPVGSLLVGSLASAVGVRATIAAGGLLSLAGPPSSPAGSCPRAAARR